MGMGDTANFTEYIAYLHKMRDNGRYRYDASMGDYRTWAKSVRTDLAAHLALTDDGTPLNAKTLCVKQHEGYREERIEISVDGYLRLKGAVLVPEDGQEKHPAMVLLNAHGWSYYYDLEKMLEPETEIPYITDMKDTYFGGHFVANELVRRGYVVVFLETFYFGDNRLDVENVPALFGEEFGVFPDKYPKGSDEYRDAINLFSRRFEAYMYKYMAFAGVTWTGLNLTNDMRAVDYAASRSDVDASRIGCLGLSLGGFRSMVLAGMDERIRCAVVAGWMASLEDMIFDKCKEHTFMMFQGSFWSKIDFPDLAALNAPNSLIVFSGAKDVQFAGVDKAFARMQRIYDDIGCPENYAHVTYDVPHCFNDDMQRDAWAFLETHLKNV